MFRSFLAALCLPAAAFAQTGETYSTDYDPETFMTMDMAINDVPLYTMAERRTIVEGGVEVCGSIHIPDPENHEFVLSRMAEGRLVIRVDWDDVFEMPADYSFYALADTAEATEAQAAACRVFAPVPEFEDARPVVIFGNMFDL